MLPYSDLSEYILKVVETEALYTILKQVCTGMFHAPEGGGGVLGSSFAEYVPLASQSPYSIIVYSVANYRPHFSHFSENVIVISSTEFNASQLF